MAEKYKKSIVVVVVLFVVFTFVVLAGKKLVLAEKGAVDAVQNYLEEHDVSYRVITESEQIIVAEIISQGE